LLHLTNPFTVFTSPDLAASSRIGQTCKRKQNVSELCRVLNNERHLVLCVSAEDN